MPKIKIGPTMAKTVPAVKSPKPNCRMFHINDVPIIAKIPPMVVINAFCFRWSSTPSPILLRPLNKIQAQLIKDKTHATVKNVGRTLMGSSFSCKFFTISCLKG